MTLAAAHEDLRWMPIGELLVPQSNGKLLQQGWSPQCLSEPSPSADVWGVLKTTAIQAGSFAGEFNKRLPETLEPRPAIEVQEGDLLLTNAGPRARCGIPTLVRKTRAKLMISGKMYRFRANEDLIFARFLEFYLLSASAQQAIDKMKTGISDSGLNLTQARFLELPVPVPSLPAQARIIDKLDERISQLDNAEQLLASATKRTSALRASALIRVSTGDSPVKTLKQVSLAAGYGTSTKCVVDGPGVPVARIPNLRNGLIDLADEKRVEDAGLDLSELMLQTDDFLVVRTNGSRDLIGRSAIVQPDVVASFASYLIRFKLDTMQVRPKWVRTMFETPRVRRLLEEMAASSAGQYNLSLGKLNKLTIPVPPLDDQDRLLKEYQEGSFREEAISAQLIVTRRRAERLRRALLASTSSASAR